MKANEFVRLEGLWVFRYALAQLSFTPKMFLVVYQYECEFVHEIKTNHGNLVFSYEEVKHLVESHELVESKGGLIKAKEILEDNPVWCSGSKRYSSPLERAIADVESCMGVSSESN